MKRYKNIVIVGREQNENPELVYKSSGKEFESITKARQYANKFEYACVYRFYFHKETGDLDYIKLF